jgi:hypothetical protein
MVFHVLRLRCENFDVARIVVLLVTIDVMDDLARQKRSA